MLVNYFTLQRCCWVVREQGENVLEPERGLISEKVQGACSSEHVVSNGINDLIYNKRRMCLLLSKAVVLLEKVGERE